MASYASLSDQELADLLRHGNETVFKIIYDRFWSKLYFVASKRLNDPAEAEEAVQDIFLNLWKNRESFQLKVNFENYLAVAIKFQVIKRRAKRFKRSIIEQQLGTEAELENFQNQNYDWNQYDLEELQGRLSKIIDTLPPKCKLVFNMSRDENYTNKKIAAELGISEKAVEKHVTQALKVLKTKLGLSLIFILFLN
ncbi:RNA polymerase sigma-70 factor [Pedobacter hiemivivus]|uniref:RNA polymerase sigma-70 factor n=1 Tax=Pedobacter hiemivivus TaxID=2530454 RepID=A0A4R0MQL4_9SPHI|nr:RNA polymerase sigma-70 factor [Pedobacter hiemivivus]TCC88983.1 RNA polymerase sigma-70 factor [Pedobacter hiemivivus]TKC62546.1 RNA polymerase sigma-70 factor [Pedobacter hiemivivus]